MAMHISSLKSSLVSGSVTKGSASFGHRKITSNSSDALLRKEHIRHSLRIRYYDTRWAQLEGHQTRRPGTSCRCSASWTAALPLLVTFVSPCCVRGYHSVGSSFSRLPHPPTTYLKNGLFSQSQYVMAAPLSL